MLNLIMVINIKENIQINVMVDISIPLKRYFYGLHNPLLVNFSHSPMVKFSGSFISVRKSFCLCIAVFLIGLLVLIILLTENDLNLNLHC